MYGNNRHVFWVLALLNSLFVVGFNRLQLVILSRCALTIKPEILWKMRIKLTPKKEGKMYLQRVFACIDRAVEATKKSAPKNMLISLIVGAVVILNGIGLLFTGVGIKLRLLGPELSGVLSLLIGILCFVSAVICLKDSIKVNKANAGAQYKQQYMNMVRALGPENAVIAHLDSLPPITCGNRELRFDQNMVACLCEDNLDEIYVYPLRLMTNMGIGGTGEDIFLFMHFFVNGKKLKKVVFVPISQGQAIIQQLKMYNPNIKIGA